MQDTGEPIRAEGADIVTSRIMVAGRVLAMLATIAGAAVADAVATPASPAVTAARSASGSPFVADSFAVPTVVETPGFKLVPLGPELVNVDFAAYMSSIEHLQKTFTRSTAWPHPTISAADAMRDMETEQARFKARTSFAYAVLTPDGRRERGCVYVYPSTVEGYDAVVRIWVTKAEFDAGFDAELYAWVTRWMAAEWPLRAVAYPGRSIAWTAWDPLVAASGPAAGAP